MSRVRSVDVYVARHHLSRPRVYAVAANADRESLLVRVADQDGVAGWGETYVRAGLPEAAARAGELLVGRDPAARRELARLVADASGSSWAASALVNAIDDLRARQLGVSVAALHGGAVRKDVQAYAAGSGYRPDRTPEQSWLEELEELTGQGFRAVKLRIGRHDQAMELAGLTAARRAFPDLQLMADANAAYTLPQSLHAAEALADLGFSFLEEPMPQSGYAGYERLTPLSPIAIAGGELLESRVLALEAVARGAFDVVQPDPSICGGIADARFIAEMSSLHGVRCVPHTCNGAVALAATLQLVALLPDPTLSPATEAPLLEWDSGENPLRTDLLREPLVLDAGRVSVPSGPGLGVDVDETVLQRYAQKVA